jgi:DNA-binding response OmpR family regulator
MKALIVTADEGIVETISFSLQLRWPGVDILFAYQENEGIELLERESIDIVILDIDLPDTQCFDMLGKICSFSDVPIIVLVAADKELEKIQVLEAGADDYIIKPPQLY